MTTNESKFSTMIALLDDAMKLSDDTRTKRAINHLVKDALVAHITCVDFDKFAELRNERLCDIIDNVTDEVVESLLCDVWQMFNPDCDFVTRKITRDEYQKWWQFYREYVLLEVALHTLARLRRDNLVCNDAEYVYYMLEQRHNELDKVEHLMPEVLYKHFVSIFHDTPHVLTSSDDMPF